MAVDISGLLPCPHGFPFADRDLVVNKRCLFVRHSLPSLERTSLDLGVLYCPRTVAGNFLTWFGYEPLPAFISLITSQYEYAGQTKRVYDLPLAV